MIFAFGRDEMGPLPACGVLEAVLTAIGVAIAGAVIAVGLIW